MAFRVLVTDGMDASAKEKLIQDGYEVVEHFYEPDKLGEALKDFDAAIVRSATKVRKEHIDIAKTGKLKLVIRAGVGMDNIDVAYGREQGLTITNTPRASSAAVAELTIALLFSCARNISIAGHSMREGKWEKKAFSKGFELFGKTIGIIGYGRIGQAVGKMAQNLGMNVLSCIHRNKPEGVECDTMHFVSMDELLAQSDIISLNCPASGKPIVDAATIAKMKDGVVIVNTSRGANIDEPALIAALNSGKVKAAGIDVWMTEKKPNMDIVNLSNVSCTPHIGAGTKEAQKRIGDELVDIIEHFSA